jgi:hypothetical protein
MNPFTYEVSCSVCGGPGVAHARDTGKDWLGVEFTHRDPRVCQSYLEAESAKKDEHIKTLEAKIKELEKPREDLPA